MANKTRPLISALTSLTMLCGFVLPATAHADEGKAVVLGFDSEAKGVDEMSDALRKEIRERGHASDKEMSLVELKLTMGCEDSDDDCIADGGSSLGADGLVFGTISGKEGSYKVTLKLLDVESKSISKTVSESFETLDAAAAKTLADGLYGAEDEPEAVPVDEPVEEGPQPEEGAEQADEGGLYWGLEENTPGWKWAGFGVSGVLMLGSLGTAIATTVAIGPNGSVRKDLLAEAEASLEASNNSNDISPNSSGDLCVLARTEVNPGEVTNAAMTKVCNKADTLSTVSTVTWIGTGVFAASTLIFTGLLFIHKKKPASEALLRHKLQFGAAPTADGLVFGSSMRF
jgi:hypothetical protein